MKNNQLSISVTRVTLLTLPLFPYGKKYIKYWLVDYPIWFEKGNFLKFSLLW